MATAVQYAGTGRRKNSVARVRLVPGNGPNHNERQVNRRIYSFR